MSSVVPRRADRAGAEWAAAYDHAAERLQLLVPNRAHDDIIAEWAASEGGWYFVRALFRSSPKLGAQWQQIGHEIAVAYWQGLRAARGH